MWSSTAKSWRGATTGYWMRKGISSSGFLSEGGRRLATLINDLLAYTRAGIDESDITTVDASAVLKETLSSLAQAIRESDAIVTYGPLPELYMGEAHLHQIFLNLVGNALKYRGDVPPRITHFRGPYRRRLAAFRFKTMGLASTLSTRRESLALIQTAPS